MSEEPEGHTEKPVQAVSRMAAQARAASRELARLSSEEKDAILDSLAGNLRERSGMIAAANEGDLRRGRASSMAEGLLDRLLLDESRIHALADQVRLLAALPDPVGVVSRGYRAHNGLDIQQVHVPFGVVGAIYEARPNVTIDIAALCLKSGNAVLLRGGSAAVETNKALISVFHDALASHGVPHGLVDTVDPWGREGAAALMAARGEVDLLVPRGGKQLIDAVVSGAQVPVIETGAGNVHIYVDPSAEPDLVEQVVVNSKTQRPSVCNAAETLVLHADYPHAGQVLRALAQAGVELRCDPRAGEVCDREGIDSLEADPLDWDTEYNALVMAVAVVDSLEEALAHITAHSTGHTEAILATDERALRSFFEGLPESAVLMANCSTRFTDGGEFGFGAEVGISTQKLHARGPMGLRELTTTQWRVRGTGQTK